MRWEEIINMESSLHPSPRELHSLCSFQNEKDNNEQIMIYLYGGRLASGQVSNELFVLNTSTFLLPIFTL